MSETDRLETRFSGGAEAPEFEDYRPISPLAIMACVAGVASLLAVVHPLLWIVPVVAVILSVAAIVRLSSPQSRYGGRNAAIASLCLAALMGSYAPARVISHDRKLFAEGRARIEDWFSLIQQGRMQEAHQLWQSPEHRFQGPGSLASFYAGVPSTNSSSEPADDLEMSPDGGGQPPAEQLKEFATWPAVAELMKFGEQARIEHLRSVEIKIAYGELKVTHLYRISGVQDGQPESVEVLIRATRHEEENLANWHVGDIEKLP